MGEWYHETIYLFIYSFTNQHSGAGLTPWHTDECSNIHIKILGQKEKQKQIQEQNENYTYVRTIV